MSSSEAVLKAISSLVEQQLSFVCLIAHKFMEYYLCLGRHQFYFLDENISTIKAQIYYAHIVRIIKDPQRKFLMQIELSEGRPDNVPKKLIIKTGNIQVLLDQIKNCWKTDYMYRLRKVGKFPLVKGKIIRNPGADPFLLKKKPPVLATKQPQACFAIEMKDYIFFVGNTYLPMQQVGFMYSEFSDTQIYVSVSEVVSLSYIQYMKERRDLRYYAEEFSDQLVRGQIYWKLKSNVYYKKSNLTADKAQWQGWEIHMRTTQRDIHVVMLRRKYIPPIMDSFQDFVFVCFGKKLGKQDYDNFNKKLQHFPTTQNTIQQCRDIADSIFYKLSNNKMYDVAVREMCNALLMDEEGFNFCQNKLRITPEGIIYSIIYLESIFKILMKANEEYYGNMIERLNQKYKHEIEGDENNQLARQGLVKKLKSLQNPPEIIDKFVASGIIMEKGSNQSLLRKWKFKVARYAAYCVNGGLMNGQFTIRNIINLLPNLENNINAYEQMLKVIDYLLYLTADNVDHQYRRMNEKAQRMNEEYQNSQVNYIYNNIIMNELLEEGFIQKELLSQEQPTLFPKFLINLLQSDNKVELKISICRQISQSIKIAQQNNSLTETQKNAFKQLVSPMVELFKSPNKFLGSMAAESLFWLSNNQNDVKLVIMQEGGGKVAVGYLSQRDERLLGYTLKLINSLIYYEQNIEIILNRGVIPKLISIVEGTGIKGTFYSNDVVVLVVMILNMLFNKADLTQQNKVIDTYPFLFSYIIDSPTYIISELTKTQVMNLLNKMVIKFEQLKIQSNKKLLPYFIDMIISKQYKDIEYTKSIIHFLLNDLKENDQGLQLFNKDEDVINAIKEMMWLGDYILTQKVKSFLILHMNIPENQLNTR